jgi:protein-tyrosine-phosphatase
MPSVLFICTGNLHRSPMAEFLFRDLLPDSSSWLITSAGTYTQNGLRTNNEVLTVLKSYGIDASSHRSKVVTRRKLHNHNLVLCLAGNHKEALRTEFPDLKDRIYLLSEMTDDTESIADPIGGPLIEYHSAAREIRDYLVRGYDRIIELAGE